MTPGDGALPTISGGASLPHSRTFVRPIRAQAWRGFQHPVRRTAFSFFNEFKMDSVNQPFHAQQSEQPAANATDAAVTYLSPKQVAVMWRTSHDKVLDFIKTGELEAFNVATRSTGRPRFRITLAAVKAFEERRSGRDPSRAAKVTERRAPRTVSSSRAKKYF